MRDFKPRQRRLTYTLFFQATNLTEGTGWGFECDATGKVDPEKLPNDTQREVYRECLKGAVKTADGETPVSKPYIVTGHHTISAQGTCDCGAHIWLDGFTNTCDRCGADYNSSGQRLAPREQWGEETGESLADILAIDGMTTDELFETEG